MQNMSSTKICALCNKEIIPLGIEGRIQYERNRPIDPEFPDIRDMNDLTVDNFKDDTHLACRILCARYFTIGLRSKWYGQKELNIGAKNKKAYEAIDAFKSLRLSEDKGNGIYLYGPPGVGKTLLLTELCKEWAKHDVYYKDIFWGNTSTILSSVRATFGKKYDYDEETYQERVFSQLKSPFVFLDDLGTEAASDWTKEILYEVINYRYEEQLPLFISSNLSPQQLSSKISDKFTSRIVDMCKPYQITGEDMRLEEKTQVVDKTLPPYLNRMASWKFMELKSIN